MAWTSSVLTLALLASGPAAASAGQTGARPRPNDPPTVVCASRSLDVRMDRAPANEAASSFRLRLTNRSPRALLAIQYEIYRGGRRVGGGRRKMDRNEPLASPGHEHWFEVTAGTSPDEGGGGPSRRVDRVVVTSVLWDDATVEGDPELLADERMIDLGKAAQIRRVLQVLRAFEGGGAEPRIADLRAAVRALPVTADLLRTSATQSGMQQVKDAVLQDLDAYERALAQRGASLETWLADERSSCEEWLARIAAR